MRKRFLTMLLGLGLVLSMFVGALGTASADHTGTQDAYFPWVPNGADLVGIDGETSGPWYGTVTVQNIESDPIEVDFYVGVPGDGYELRRTEAVDPYASTTVSSAQLAVSGDGDGFAVKAVGYLQREQTVSNEDDDGDTVIPAVRAHIAGAAKQVSPIASSDGKTNSGHLEVDGYSAQTENMVSGGNHILPIVQTNSGWNTDIKIANWSDGGASQSITVNFYGAFGEGVSGSSSGTYSLSLDPGEVESVNLDQLEGSLGLGEEFVGSAWIESSSTAQISAVAERVKPMDDMLVMNTSRPESHGNGTKYAPLVFQNYNMWNTGISVANLSDSINTVQIDFHGPTTSGQVSEVLEIAPRSMEYLYIPGVQELGLDDDGFVGSAILQGTGDFHASVDQIKYFGSGQDVGSAMSYITEHETAGDSNPQDAVGDGMALPIYGKGNDAGSGDTSGIQLFNASADESVNAHITFYNQAGNPVAPTINTPRTVSLAPRESRTVYALHMGTMPDGFFGSAIISVSGDGELVGVSNQVNYDVGGDGSVAFNLVRVPGEPAPSTATNVDIDPVTDTNVWGDTHSITVTVTDQFGQPMGDVGVNATITEGPHRNFSHESDVKSGSTDGDGNFVISYLGGNPHHGLSQDTLAITVDGVDGVFTATKTWEFGEPDRLELAHVEEFEGEIPANVIFYDEHEVVATVYDQNDNLLMHVDVDFNVEFADGQSGSDTTDAIGQAFFSYTSENTTPQTPHSIVATVPGTDLSASVQKNWVDFEISLAHYAEYDSAVPNITFVTEHEVVASLTRVDTGAGIDGAEIGFNIDGNQVQTGTTDGDGNVSFFYTGEEAGDDQLSATALLANRTSAEITKTWVDLAVQVTPEESTNNVGDQHTVTVQIGYDDNGTFVPVEMSGYAVELALDGAETNAHPEFFPRNLNTGATGSASYTYTGARVGTDHFIATLGVNGNQATATKTWIDMEINITGQGDATNYVHIEEHFVTVQATDEGSGDGIEGASVEFIISGPNSGADVRWENNDAGSDSTNVGTTGADGYVTFYYTGANAGADNLQARFAGGGSFAPQVESKNWLGIYLELEHVGALLFDDETGAAVNQDGDEHTVLATLVNADGDTLSGFNAGDVEFFVDGITDGSNVVSSSDDTPSINDGTATFSYVYNSFSDGETHDISVWLLSAQGTSNEIQAGPIQKTWYAPAGADVEMFAGEQFVLTDLWEDANPDYDAFEISAVVTDQFGLPVEGETVTFGYEFLPGDQEGAYVDEDGNETTTATGVTDANGIATAVIFASNREVFPRPVDADLTASIPSGASDAITVTFEEVARVITNIDLAFEPAPVDPLGPVYATEPNVIVTATVYDQFGNTMNNVLVTFEMFEDMGATGPVNDFPDNIGLRNIGNNYAFQPIVTEPTDVNGEATIIARKSIFTPVPANAFVGARAGQNENVVEATDGDDNVIVQEIIWVAVPSALQLSPDYDLNYTGPGSNATHTVEAQVLDQYGFPYTGGAGLGGQTVTFVATDTAFGEDPVIFEGTLDNTGFAVSDPYSRTVNAEDEITASVTVDFDYGAGPMNNVISEVYPVYKDWVVLDVDVSPATAFNTALAEPHTFTAQLVDNNGDPVALAGQTITWSFDSTDFEVGDIFDGPVVSGEISAWDGDVAVSETDGAGQATFTYTGGQRDLVDMPYTHSVRATLDNGLDGSGSKTWNPLGIQIMHADTEEDEAFNIDGELHTVVLQLIDTNGNPVEAAGIDVSFFSSATGDEFGDFDVQGVHDPNQAPEPNLWIDGETNAQGQLAFTSGYTLGELDEGSFSLDLWAFIVDTDVESNVVTKTWYAQEPTTIALNAGTQQEDDGTGYYFFEFTATVYDQQNVELENASVEFATNPNPGFGSFWDGTTLLGQTSSGHDPALVTDVNGQTTVVFVSDPAADFPLYPADVTVEATSGAATSNQVTRTFVDDPVAPTGIVLTADPNPTTSGRTFELDAQVQYLGNDLDMENLEIEFEMISGFTNYPLNRVGLRSTTNPLSGEFYEKWSSSTDAFGVAEMLALRGILTAPPRTATVVARWNGLESNPVTLNWIQDPEIVLSASPNPVTEENPNAFTVLTLSTTGDNWSAGDDVQVCRSPLGGYSGFFYNPDSGSLNQDCVTVQLDGSGDFDGGLTYGFNTGFAPSFGTIITYTATYQGSFNPSDSVTVTWEINEAEPEPAEEELE